MSLIRFICFYIINNKRVQENAVHIYRVFGKQCNHFICDYEALVERTFWSNNNICYELFYDLEYYSFNLMSQQPDAFLQMASSHHFGEAKVNDYKQNTISPANFQKWSQLYMYKTSYGCFHSKDSDQPRNTAIPGYAGYIPGLIADNMHGRRYSAMARQSFENLGLATNKYNLDRTTMIDRDKIASTSKYGKSQIQRAHPSLNGVWQSTNHQSFKDPRKLLDPTFRPTQKYLQTQKPITKSSGYAINNSEQDGYGWKPDPVLKGDNNRTEYRDRYNADHPFHRNTHLAKPAQLPKKQYNYRFN